MEAYLAAGWDRFGTIVGDLTSDMVDGIGELEADENLNNLDDLNDQKVPTYDLMGRRVSDLKPGNIYIRNGKKFMLSK